MPFQVRRVSDARKKHRIPWDKIPILLKLTRPLVQWYGAWKKRRDEEKQHEKHMLLLKRIALILCAVLAVVILLAGTVRALVGLRIISLNTFLDAAGTELPKDEHGFTNLLLLGVGDKDHDGIDLTDTLIVASIDPLQTKSVVLLSLPRDLYLLKTEKMGKGRINSLYRDYKIALRRKGMKEAEASQEALKELAREVGAQLGLTIHATVKTDFTAFEKAVDTIGGIDLVVPEDIVDTEYPDANYGFSTFSIKAGPAHLDGATALKYVRSRHTSSDFSRSARQQSVIVAIGEKVKSEGFYKNPSTVTKLWKIFADHVEMTIGIRELLGLARLAEDITPDRVIAMQLSDRSGLFGDIALPGGFLYTPPRDQFDGAAVLLPISIPEFPVTWKQIRSLTSLLFMKRTEYLAHPSIAVLNAGGKTGMGRKLGNELIRYGWDVPSIANVKGEKAKASVVVPQTEADKPLAQFFADLLGLPLGSLPAKADPLTARRVTIVIGSAYTYRPLQDLVKTESAASSSSSKAASSRSAAASLRSASASQKSSARSRVSVSL